MSLYGKKGGTSATAGRTTPAEVNRALKKAGFADVTIYRGNGYYYFDDETTAIPSIYANALRCSTAHVVGHVREELARIRKEQGLTEHKVYYNVVGASGALYDEVFWAKDEDHARRLFKRRHPDEFHQSREVVKVDPGAAS